MIYFHQSLTWLKLSFLALLAHLWSLNPENTVFSGLISVHISNKSRCYISYTDAHLCFGVLFTSFDSYSLTSFLPQVFCCLPIYNVYPFWVLVLSNWYILLLWLILIIVSISMNHFWNMSTYVIPYHLFTWLVLSNIIHTSLSLSN